MRDIYETECICIYDLNGKQYVSVLYTHVLEPPRDIQYWPPDLISHSYPWGLLCQISPSQQMVLSPPWLLSLTSGIWYFSKFHWLFLQYISNIWSFLAIFMATTLMEATTISMRLLKCLPKLPVRFPPCLPSACSPPCSQNGLFEEKSVHDSSAQSLKGQSVTLRVKSWFTAVVFMTPLSPAPVASPTDTRTSVLL